MPGKAGRSPSHTGRYSKLLSLRFGDFWALDAAWTLEAKKKYAHERVQFFPKPSAFNIGWHEQPKRRISSFAAPRGVLTKPGYDNHEGDHSAHYPGFPALAAAANAFGE
jgi:hypothetical protein